LIDIIILLEWLGYQPIKVAFQTQVHWKNMQNLQKKNQKKHAHNLLQFPAEINTIVGVKQTQTNLIFFSQKKILFEWKIIDL